MHVLAMWHRYGSSDHVKDISPLKHPQSKEKYKKAQSVEEILGGI